MKLFRMSLWSSLMVVCFLLIATSNLVESKCAFEAIFNFGDSNTDTGGFYAAFPSQGSPYGMTYFKKPVGRPTDGRVIVDFLGILSFTFSDESFFYTVTVYSSETLNRFKLYT